MQVPDADRVPEIEGAFVAVTDVVPADPSFLYPAERLLYEALPNPTRQVEWLAGRRAARGALRAVGAGAAQVLRDDLGAPRLVGPHAQGAEIALTHGKHHAAAIATRTDSPWPHVGIDWIDADDEKRVRRIAHRVLTPKEHEMCRLQPSLLLACWGAREAAAKATRTGMFAYALSGVHVLDYDSGSGRLELNIPGLKAYLRFVENDVLVVAGANAECFRAAKAHVAEREKNTP